MNPKDKRMAQRTEDHPMEYETFEGIIPEGEYRAGRVTGWGQRRKPVSSQPESVLSGRSLDELT